MLFKFGESWVEIWGYKDLSFPAWTVSCLASVCFLVKQIDATKPPLPRMCFASRATCAVSFRIKGFVFSVCSMITESTLFYLTVACLAQGPLGKDCK